MPNGDSDRKDTTDSLPRVSATEANLRLGYLISRATYAGERTVIVRRGEPVAALVPIADLERLLEPAAA